MTPAEFVAKWTASPKRERVDSQPQFLDLCRLLEIDDPATADPQHEWFTFERGASKTSGGNGWADVWRRGCFGWEYKGVGGDLDKAYRQLLNYSVALENPPLLIVSDMARFRVHTNWTNTVQETHEFTLADLADAKWRDLLRDCFLNPDALKPKKTRTALTEEAASKFAALALRLRARGFEAEAVAHFVNRLVFCMFAEDVGLLPSHIFRRMLEACQSAPADFEVHARTLFAAMRSGGMVGFERVEWFNGGLFDDDTTFPLDREDLREVLAAAKLDWSDIDPSILGTLFERGLDPDKRSQLGAHYTDREKIMQIVRPVIVEPLTREWEAVKAKIETALARERAAKSLSTATRAHNEARRLFVAFLERLRGFRVLDPACGSGNFLYLSLLSLKDLENLVILEGEALGFGREFPGVGPEAVKGIELNPYAAELARVSVWIGEIQWMRRNGFEATKNPILKPLENIECRDAVLTPQGERAEWPSVDVVVGNPPFLGAKKMRSEMGAEYVERLRLAWSKDVPGLADLVAYWFAKASSFLEHNKTERVGFVATNSIRDGASNAVLKRLPPTVSIYQAISDQSWTVEGASVRVSIVCFGYHGGTPVLNGREVFGIESNLKEKSTKLHLTSLEKMRENDSVAFIGIQKNGRFDVSRDVASNWLLSPHNPNLTHNKDVLRPLMSGRDFTARDRARWIIDFFGLSEAEAMFFEEPYKHCRDLIYPERLTNARNGRREKWWLFGENMPKMRGKVRGLDRHIARSLTSKHHLFGWCCSGVLCDSTCVVIARDDDTTFGILHSFLHEIWAVRAGAFLGAGNDPRYTPSTTFETFPFPEGLTPNIPAAAYADDPRAQKIADAAAQLNTLRENWLNPPDLVRREPEVVPGYPDRILPKDETAAKELKKRTLTNLYNARPAWLAHAHAALDEAVAEAYGWGDDWRDGKLDDDEILARLFALNQARAGK
ncbi:class I SAM-dependent DNA methyltransferase [Albimonas sp. CAU 1670]|uniref:class I SAM-dependent DNA methyltransferase n=1 Tax=Albimonas sp. CAU 1670 TaxID=3032599 RepID=UPI0023DC51F5|nr:class I SAM-dependent DNA methyltransferase [Albimonas sp. CAU 1670]MDF2234958.1 class I SAM-dependent DNA methyltransferase [Albimonas sp. CAU 1670]